ncbi:MAG: TetR/AcrR family transcriptional regulator [Verrucomicrobiota bacterium]
MGRPSVQAERKQEILDAFEKCVALYGIEGATLERIAEVSGLSRPLIRHHAGNRDDLLAGLGERFQERAEALTETLVREISGDDRANSLLNRLFEEHKSDFELVLFAEALIASSANHPELEKVVVQWIQGFHEAVEAQLRAAYPEASGERVQVVATGIVGIYFNANSLAPLTELAELRPDSMAAARLLVESLSDRG